jgi:hypothetical protein
MTWTQLGWFINDYYTYVAYSFRDGVGALAVDVVLYLVLFIYMDQVMPNETGT